MLLQHCNILFFAEKPLRSYNIFNFNILLKGAQMYCLFISICLTLVAAQTYTSEQSISLSNQSQLIEERRKLGNQASEAHRQYQKARAQDRMRNRCSAVCAVYQQAADKELRELSSLILRLQKRISEINGQLLIESEPITTTTSPIQVCSKILPIMDTPDKPEQTSKPTTTTDTKKPTAQSPCTTSSQLIKPGTPRVSHKDL